MPLLEDAGHVRVAVAVIEGGAIAPARAVAAWPIGTMADRQADAPPAAPEERCDLCSVSIPADHRHMLHVEERRIVCTCETCRALFAGDGPYRPAGSRTAWLDGFELPDELWASFRIPIGLVFFFRSSTAGGVVAMYPSPAGTTECELDLGPWERLVAANPVLEGLETDVEALIVNRLGARGSTRSPRSTSATGSSAWCG